MYCVVLNVLCDIKCTVILNVFCGIKCTVVLNVLCGITWLFIGLVCIVPFFLQSKCVHLPIKCHFLYMSSRIYRNIIMLCNIIYI